MEEIYESLLRDKAENYANAFRDPATVARKLADWAQANLPDKVQSALWITAKGDDDKGISVELKEVPLWKGLSLKIGAVLGTWSGGLVGTVPAGDWKGIAVAVGAGIVVRYDDLEDIQPIAVMTFRF